MMTENNLFQSQDTGSRDMRTHTNLVLIFVAVNGIESKLGNAFFFKFCGRTYRILFGIIPKGTSVRNVIILLSYVSIFVGYVGRGITDDDKTLILKAHNDFRSCIATGENSGNCKGVDQPTATNIQEMVWDDALAGTAQKWADECKFAHDTKENRYDPRFCVGQNVHITKLTHENDSYERADFPHAIAKWFGEHTDYAYSRHTNVTKRKTGHYTQMIWANSNLVGCGYAYFKDKYDQYYVLKKLYVCNYGPCGNKLDKFPYDHGKPACDAYNMAWSAYGGLCVELNTSPLESQESHLIESLASEEVEKTTAVENKIETNKPPSEFLKPPLPFAGIELMNSDRPLNTMEIQGQGEQ